VTDLDRELARAFLAAVREDADLRAELRALLLPDQGTESEPPWLGIDEAAAYLRVSERTLERRIKKGHLRSTTIGRRRLLHRDDLDALAKAAAGEGVAPTTPPRRRTGVR
jgi:excisionase family DNA binding protein